MKRSLVFAIGWLMLMVPAANFSVWDVQAFHEAGGRDGVTCG